jgi:hypothetical protein
VEVASGYRIQIRASVAQHPFHFDDKPFKLTAVPC